MLGGYAASMVATHPFTLALIAHDGKKDDIVRFAREHLEELRGVSLVATATTGALLLMRSLHHELTG